jgi:hypothetical protein
MNSLTEVLPIGSATCRGTKLKRLFIVGYLTAITVSTIGWVSAFGWGHRPSGKVADSLD